MEVTFATKKLEKYFLTHKEALRRFGEQVAKRYIQRINIIQRAKSIHELRNLPGLRCHPLKADREGQWAVWLNDRYRLIFELTDEAQTTVRVLEVSKHYGD